MQFQIDDLDVTCGLDTLHTLHGDHGVWWREEDGAGRDGDRQCQMPIGRQIGNLLDITVVEDFFVLEDEMKLVAIDKIEATLFRMDAGQEHALELEIGSLRQDLDALTA